VVKLDNKTKDFKMKKIILAICLVITTSLMSAEKSNEITKLSNGLKGLLSAEMVEVNKSMKEIFESIVKADYENVAKWATGIENSFILKKSLTKAQGKELTIKVSKEFLTQDKNFHETAGKLATAAEFENKEDINKYFFEMTNSCVKCHSTFATHRFPNFE
jgi:cytochrome c556